MCADLGREGIGLVTMMRGDHRPAARLAGAYGLDASSLRYAFSDQQTSPIISTESDSSL
jgi:hypothetical protein